MKILSLIMSTTLVLSLSASEIDSFTKRYIPLEDSLGKINQKTQEFFVEAIKLANDKGDGCEEKVLYKSMRKYFRNHIRGELTPYIIKTDELDKHITPIKQSIYREFGLLEAPIQGLYGKTFKDPSGHLLQVNGHLIGTDKFEHFLGSGFRYFKKHYLEQKGLKSALDIGTKAETGFMGARTTGVVAYADMVANFNGMRFWNHLLSQNPDILGEDLGPYVRCENNEWKIIKEINWADYIDHAWDEGINCSKFRTDRLTQKVLNQIDLLEKEDTLSRRFACPVEPQKLIEASKKYGDLTEIMFNFKGHVTLEKDKD